MVSFCSLLVCYICVNLFLLFVPPSWLWKAGRISFVKLIPNTRQPQESHLRLAYVPQGSLPHGLSERSLCASGCLDVARLCALEARRLSRCAVRGVREGRLLARRIRVFLQDGVAALKDVVAMHFLGMGGGGSSVHVHDGG